MMRVWQCSSAAQSAELRRDPHVTLFHLLPHQPGIVAVTLNQLVMRPLLD
jgi:hypothetical protein